MIPRLKQARKNILKSARELDRASKCSQAKQKIMAVVAKALLKEFYKY